MEFEDNLAPDVVLTYKEKTLSHAIQKTHAAFYRITDNTQRDYFHSTRAAVISN